MKLKIKNINTCESILSIRHVNPMFVSRYRQAMRNGDQFPPLLLDQENRVISGNHRFQAYWEEFGEDHAVEVIRKRYSNEAERIEDAIKENARHGNPLDGISRKRAILKLSELGRASESIAKVLGVPVRRIEEIANETVVVIGGGRKSVKPLKRGLSHLRGQEVTQTQYESHETVDRGVNAVFLANQLTRWLKNGWVDLENAKTVEAMQHLHKELSKALE